MKLVLNMPHTSEDQTGDICRTLEAAVRTAYARGELAMGFIEFDDLAEAIRNAAPKRRPCPCIQCAQSRLEAEKP